MVKINVYDYVQQDSYTMASLGTQSRHVQEVVQHQSSLPADQCRTVEIKDIVDVCFVFSREEVDAARIICQGRHDCFVVSAGGSAQHQPFPTTILSMSYASRVWEDTEACRRQLRKLLSCTRQSQGHFSRGSACCTISQEGWQYMCRQVTGKAGVSMSFKEKGRSQVESELLPGFGILAKRRRADLERIEFQNEEGVSSVGTLFGEAAIFGLRVKRPKITEPRKFAGVNDIANFVTDCFIEFDGREARIRVSYKAHHFIAVPSFPTNRMQRLYQRQLASDVPAQQHPGTPVPTIDDLVVGSDDEFVHDGKLHRVTRVAGSLTWVTDDGELGEFTLDSQAVRVLVQSYLE